MELADRIARGAANPIVPPLAKQAGLPLRGLVIMNAG